jgi:hypothetical protein
MVFFTDRARRGRRWAVIMVVGIASLVVVGGAAANTFGGYELHKPCCGTDGLWGTRSNISVPSSLGLFGAGSAGCVLARSESEGDAGTSLIQAGFVRCASGYSLDGTCSTSNNLVNFVEVGQFGVLTCYPKGSVGLGTTHTYSVTNTSPNADRWLAYIDGVADTNGLSMNTADFLVEGTEHTTPGQGGSYAVNVSWGSGLAWQRWNRSSWATVQSAYVLITSGSGWSVTGAPPGVWSVSH